MKSFKNLALVTQIAISMISPIFMGLLIGNYLDKKLKTSPYLVIIFMVLGVCSGFLMAYKDVEKQLFKKKKGNQNNAKKYKK